MVAEFVLAWHDGGVPDLARSLRRVNHLCDSLDSDATLRAELDRAGFSEHDWTRLVSAVRGGELDDVTELLDAIDNVAVEIGIDGVTWVDREYRILPTPAQPRTISGWRCPHPQSCGRVRMGTDPAAAPHCALTGDPLAWVSVTSG